MTARETGNLCEHALTGMRNIQDHICAVYVFHVVKLCELESELACTTYINLGAGEAGRKRLRGILPTLEVVKIIGYSKLFVDR